MCNHIHHTWMCLTVCLLTYSNGMNLGTAFIAFSNVCPRLSLGSQIHDSSLDYTNNWILYIWNPYISSAISYSSLSTFLPILCSYWHYWTQVKECGEWLWAFQGYNTDADVSALIEQHSPFSRNQFLTQPAGHLFCRWSHGHTTTMATFSYCMYNCIDIYCCITALCHTQVYSHTAIPLEVPES